VSVIICSYWWPSWWYIYSVVVTQEHFGKALKRTRLMMRDDEGKLVPWTQYRLHVASGVSESAICQIEKGERDPQDVTKAKLADALGAPALLEL
jgi:transcriptional regulator with XRE-family HTH domain